MSRLARLGSGKFGFYQPQKDNSRRVHGTENKSKIKHDFGFYMAAWDLIDMFHSIGYLDWFEDVVKLILEKLPEKGRAIFMQTDVKAKAFSV